ncbi:sec31 [Symbiodinium necroappetens]|uniref:Sec31 protein n=1 Tax=Symbiodinium necroappetens TaxID=1628268 RepID=A0A812U6C6_9DINO|nr:sec31 [Symbiodinium necroappetens]
MAAWGRTQSELPAGEVLARSAAQLDDATASALRGDYAWLEACLRRQPARNDRAWILTTGNQFCPKQPAMQQQLWPIVVSCLRQRLPEGLVQEVADTIFNMAPALWYQDYIMVLLPWLGPSEQLRFQQWFQEYERHQFLALPRGVEDAAQPPGETLDRHVLPRGSNVKYCDPFEVFEGQYRRRRLSRRQDMRPIVTAGQSLRTKSSLDATALDPQDTPHPRLDSLTQTTLKQFWDAKCDVRDALAATDNYSSPVILYIADCSLNAVRRVFPGVANGLRCWIRAWRSLLHFHGLDRQMRKSARARKLKQLEGLLREAQSSPSQGVLGLYRIIHRFKPKSSKRTIHFRNAAGQLLTAQEELQQLKHYLGALFQESDKPPVPDWYLHEGLMPTLGEVTSALTSLPCSKALPNGHAPAALWRHNVDALAPVVTHQLQHALGGKASHDSAEPAPDLSAACYVKGEYRNSLFDKRAGVQHRHFCGGMQVSFDLSKAYDRIPRDKLHQALTRIAAPPDLISAIMYIHDNASIVLERHGLTASVDLAAGIRQGCGLSPLLWLAFTLLLYDELLPLCPQEAITCFADDFHVHWTLATPRDFRNACQQILRIFDVFKRYGMSIAMDKTVILLAMKGPEVPGLLKEHVRWKGRDRVLVLPTEDGTLQLPIRNSHKYLGVHIGYHKFERTTLSARLKLSWIAFSRLHVFLKHPGIPVLRRLSLWRTYVWAILQYGLTSVGLDAWSVDKLRSQVAKQDPVAMLLAACSKRVEASEQAIGFEDRQQCTVNPAPYCGCVGIFSIALAPWMIQELREAAAELEREPSTAAGSARNCQGSEELVPDRNSVPARMEVDREKRLAEEQAGEAATTKWPRSHSKGDRKGDEPPEPEATLNPEPAGKGRAPSPTRPLQRRSRQGQEQRGQGSQQQQRQAWWGQQRRASDRNDRGYRQDRRVQDRETALQDLVVATGRLTLRIEDSLNVYGLDTSFMLFLQTRESEKGWTITKQLYSVAKEWNRQKAEDATVLTQPMRTVLLHCLLAALRDRLRSMETDTEICLKAKEMGLTDGTSYLYLRWNPTDHRYERGTQEPLAHAKAVEIVDYLVQLTSFPDTVGKFHPLRKLTESMESEVIPFALQIQNRTQEAHQMYCLMRRLCRNGCLHLVGATARPTQLGRSPLAVHIDQLLQAVQR